MFKTRFISPICLLLASACGVPIDSIDGYLEDLPSWSAFAPPEFPSEDEGEEVPMGPEILEDVFDGDTLYTCTTRPVSFFKTPREYAMFSPPLDILYPGALIQGRSLRDGSGPGDLLPLTVAERTPVDITIPACVTDDNSRTVAPNLAAVNQAISSIVASAVRQDLDCVQAVGDLKQETYRNEAHRGLSVGASGRYFGASARSDVRVDKSKTENALSVTFTEQLFRVQYQAPQTPSEVFSDAFTPDRLEQQVALGRIGPDNLPVYVAEVTYGRLMNFTMVSSAEESAMRAAVSAKYQNPLGTSLDGSISAEQESLLQEARYSVAYLGGSAEANAAMLKSLAWDDYFSVPVGVTDAVPIAVTLRNLSDNSVATMQELTSYDVTECVARDGAAPSFSMPEGTTVVPAFDGPTAQWMDTGDLDGDGADDLVWAARSRDQLGAIRVARATGHGDFFAMESTEHPALRNKTGDLSLFLEDVDADGRKDVILALLAASGVTVTVSFRKEEGWVHSREHVFWGPGAWREYRPRMAELDGMPGMDLVLNNHPISPGRNTSYVVVSLAAEPGVDLASDALLRPVGGFSHPANDFRGYEYAHLADFNGDGLADFLWQNIDGDGNRYYAGIATGSGFRFPGLVTLGTTPWRSYGALAGDVNGDQIADLVQPRVREGFSDFAVYVGEGQRGSHVMSRHRFHFADRVADLALRDVIGASSPLFPDFFLGDVNGDGLQDLIVNDKGRGSPLRNAFAVGVARVQEDGNFERFSFLRASQTHPVAQDWSGFEMHVADVNGDRRQDLVWVQSGIETQIYVALAER